MVKMHSKGVPKLQKYNLSVCLSIFRFPHLSWLCVFLNLFHRSLGCMWHVSYHMQANLSTISQRVTWFKNVRKEELDQTVLGGRVARSNCYHLRLPLGTSTVQFLTWAVWIFQHWIFCFNFQFFPSLIASAHGDPISIGMVVAEAIPSPTRCDLREVDKVNLNDIA